MTHDIDAMVEEMVRDFTTAHPKTKSEVRRRILEAIEEAEKRGEERAHMTEKSSLDEFIDTAREAYFYGCDEEEIRERSVSFPCVERLIRLAVEKHAEAVQDGVSFKSNAGEEFDSKFNKQIREEIQSVSDKWRGC